MYTSPIARLTGIVITIFSCVLVPPAVAQTTTCGNAVSRLQHYVAGVNSFANMEYYQNIPMRCGGNWGCQQMWLQQLNGWYMQQSNLVNGWYSQILTGCNAQGGSGNQGVGGRTGGNKPPIIEESDVETIDIDEEDKTVRIRIPSTPSGYRH